MENMNRSLFALLCLLWPLYDVSCDGVKTEDTHVPDDTPAPIITRDYPPCTGASSPKCPVVCSVSSVAQAQLSWFNGSVSISSLTISALNNKLNLMVEHQDKNNYSCVVSSSGTNQTKHLNITQICQPCPAKPSTTVSVTEGDSVTLPSKLTHLQDGDDVMWFYKRLHIAELNGNITAFYGCDDGRFTNRLQLDSKTGSLTITNISKIHSGLYELLITDRHDMSNYYKKTNGTREDCQSYNVTVYDLLPSPVITNNSTQCSSPSKKSKCVVMCSVNVTHVTLSWYKGNSLLSNISVSDLKRNFLCLEVDYQDKNTYCMVNNPISRKTTGLNITDLCKDHSHHSNASLVIGILFCICLLCVVVCIWWRRRRQAYRRY